MRQARQACLIIPLQQPGIRVHQALPHVCQLGGGGGCVGAPLRRLARQHPLPLRQQLVLQRSKLAQLPPLAGLKGEHRCQARGARRRRLGRRLRLSRLLGQAPALGAGAVRGHAHLGLQAGGRRRLVAAAQPVGLKRSHLLFAAGPPSAGEKEKNDTRG